MAHSVSVWYRERLKQSKILFIVTFDYIPHVIVEMRFPITIEEIIEIMSLIMLSGSGIDKCDQNCKMLD